MLIIKVFLGETDQCDNRISEYEIDNDGKYKQISTPIEFSKGGLNGIILIKDGRLITSSEFNVRIWS